MSTERESALAADLERLDRIVSSFENEPNAALRERVLELIETIDAVHRQLVWDLGERIWEQDASLFERLLEDPRAAVLFELYGLVAPSRQPEAAPAGDADAVVAVDALVSTIPPPRERERSGT